MNGTEICNYVDDITLYSCDYGVKNVITRLEQDTNRLTARFPETIGNIIVFGASKKELEKPRPR